MPWGRGRVGRLRKAQLAAGSQGSTLVGKWENVCWVSVVCSSGRAGIPPLSWMVLCLHAGPVGLLGSCRAPKDRAAGEEALEFFGDVGFVVCLFVCFFSCLVSREHSLSQTGISWVVVSFSGKPVFLSFPFPLGKSLFQLPFRALPPAVPATPAFAHSILYQRRGKH